MTLQTIQHDTAAAPAPPTFTGMSAFSGRILVTLANQTEGFPQTRDGKALLTTIDRGRVLTDLGYKVERESSIAGPNGVPVFLRYRVTRPERTHRNRDGETVTEPSHIYVVDATVVDSESGPVVVVECSPECPMFARMGVCCHSESVALRCERMIRARAADWGD